jgi:hypothetical protein
MADEFEAGKRTRPHILKRQHADVLGVDFWPSSIDRRLLSHQPNTFPEIYDITLLGL